MSLLLTSLIQTTSLYSTEAKGRSLGRMNWREKTNAMKGTSLVPSHSSKTLRNEKMLNIHSKSFCISKLSNRISNYRKPPINFRQLSVFFPKYTSLKEGQNCIPLIRLEVHAPPSSLKYSDWS